MSGKLWRDGSSSQVRFVCSTLSAIYIYIKGHANKWSRFAKSHRARRLCALFKQKRIVDNEKKVILSVARFFSYLHAGVLSRYVLPTHSFSDLWGIATVWEQNCILTLHSRQLVYCE